MGVLDLALLSLSYGILDAQDGSGLNLSLSASVSGFAFGSEGGQLVIPH